MALQNNLSAQGTGKRKFSVVIQSESIQKLINNTLGDTKKSQKFVTAISSAVAVNPQLQECDGFSIVNAALLGETLQLSPSPQLGHYYMVPFNDKNKGKVATFELGYKGYLQLAIRSGRYKKINVLEIKKGELINFDPLNEELEINLIQDELEREKAETIGYYAMFELVNGFKKALYWSKEKMLSHADKYSAAFNAKSYNDLITGKIPDKDKWKYSSFWYKDFDGMAFKTMLRQLISKWGIMSIELQTAFEGDYTFKDASGNSTYVEEANEPLINSDIEVTQVHEEVTPVDAQSKKEVVGQESIALL